MGSRVYELFSKFILHTSGIICLMFLVYNSLESCKSHDSIEITGPGLRPDLIVMPARYFFIDFPASSFSREISPDNIKVDINGVNKFHRDCRVWVNLLDRKDGLFIVRYKLYESCNSMRIIVKYNGNLIGNSPYLINGTVQPDDCPCPKPLEDWLNHFNCPSTYAQIDKDMEPFKNVHFSLFHEYVMKKVGHSGSMSVCNYIIKQNDIYRKCYGEHTGFKMFFDAILTSLARKVRLPDVEMFVNLGDWPLSQLSSDRMFPIFSWCGSQTTADIVMPTYDITESSLEAMGRVSLDMLSVQGNTDYLWDGREPRAFWRGRDSSRERLKLIEIARKHPDLINASLTNFFFFRDQEHIYGPKENHVSFFKFFHYKYQVNLDGTVAAYRLPYLLAGGSLVLKQDSEYYEHFYGDLSPWKHYVPVKRDLSDLVDRVVWARENDEEAHKIAKAGEMYATNHLLPQHIFCYHTVLLKEWRQRLKEPIEVREGMDMVHQTENLHCMCESSSDLRDEL